MARRYRFSGRRRGSKNVRRSTRRRASRGGRRKSLFEGLIKMNKRTGRRMIFNRKGRWGIMDKLRKLSFGNKNNNPAVAALVLKHNLTQLNAPGRPSEHSSGFVKEGGKWVRRKN